MRQAGIARLGPLLGPARAAELRSYFEAREVADPYRPTEGSYLPGSGRRHANSHVAFHTARDVVLAPYLLELVNRPDLIDLASRILGCRPTIGYLAAWWSYATPIGAQEAENFHRDVDDWRFLKLFIYLSDVTADDGPHIYVQNSVSSPRLREIRRFSNEEVVTSFGQENILTLVGPAGDAFIENTFGLHKGQPVMRGPRLIFQVVYSMFPVPYGPKKPVASLNDVGVSAPGRPDPWINRVYLNHP